MKKVIVIFSFLLITLFSVGSFIVFSTYISFHQSTFQASLKKINQNLFTTKIFINPSELYTNSKNLIWEDDNKEIIKEGILYDIISIDSKDGKIMLTVISDSKEQEIKKQFASLYKDNYTHPSNNLTKLLKQLLALKFLFYFNSSFNSNQHFSTISYVRFNLLKDKPVFLPKEVPPPNFFA